MPYSPDNPPDKLKGLPENKQRQWVEVFNSCWKEHEDDAKCHAMAWGVVKKASCTLCGAQRELLNIALDLQDIEPKIAMVLLQEAKALR
jgi:cation transport regulator ChaB